MSGVINFFGGGGSGGGSGKGSAEMEIKGKAEQKGKGVGGGKGGKRGAVEAGVANPGDFNEVVWEIRMEWMRWIREPRRSWPLNPPLRGKMCGVEEMPKAVEVMSAVVADWAHKVVYGGRILAAADERWQRWYLRWRNYEWLGDAEMTEEWKNWIWKVDEYMDQVLRGMAEEIGEQNIKRLNEAIKAAMVVEWWRWKAWIQERDGIRRGGKAGSGLVAVGGSEARAWWRRFGWLDVELEAVERWEAAREVGSGRRARVAYGWGGEVYDRAAAATDGWV